MKSTSNDISAEFKGWMDARRLKASEVAEALHVSEQTVHHWRSSGIPPRRQPVVQHWMREFDGDADRRVADLRAQTLVIEASREEFRAWNAAALAEGKLIEDWVKDGLNQMADDCVSRRPQEDAEDPVGDVIRQARSEKQEH